MNSLLKFLEMEGDYDSRKVDRIEDDKGMVISTARVIDGEFPYETAIKHPRYHDGLWIIVEAYETKERAEVGHKKWVRKMTGKKLPASLTDCANANIAAFGASLGMDLTYHLDGKGDWTWEL